MINIKTEHENALFNLHQYCHFINIHRYQNLITKQQSTEVLFPAIFKYIILQVSESLFLLNTVFVWLLENINKDSKLLKNYKCSKHIYFNIDKNNKNDYIVRL